MTRHERTIEITDEDFVRYPSIWPKWLFLPMMRGKESGVLMVTISGYSFALGSYWSLNVDSTRFNVCVPEQILAEGWEVDE